MASPKEQKTSYEAWKQYLSEPRALLKFPTDLPRPDQYTPSMATLTQSIPAAVVQKLNAKTTHSSTLAYLLATFAVHLHRLCGEEDVIVGACFSNAQGYGLCFIDEMVFDDEVLG